MTTPSVPANWKIWTAFWLAALFWGTSFLWIKLGLENWNPVSLVAFRLLIAAGLFALVLTGARRKVRFSRKEIYVFAVVAFLNPFLPFLLITWAEQSITSGTASILNATVPLFMMVITPFLLPSEKPTIRTLVGVMVGFMGVAILFGRKAEFSAGASPGFAYIGELAVLLASFSYAFSTAFLKRFNIQSHPFHQAAMLNGLACLYVWIHGTITGGITLPTMGINWIAVLWLGALGSFSAYSLVMVVITYKGATQATLINFAYPLLGLFLGVLFLGEPFSWFLLVGGILILIGIAIVKFVPQKKTRAVSATLPSTLGVPPKH